MGYGLYAGFVWLGIGPWLASLMALVLGILFNFQSIGRLVFRNDGAGRYLWFIAVYAVTYVVNLAELELFLRLGAGPYLAQALSLPLIAVTSYQLNKRWVFEPAGLSADQPR